MRWLLTPQLVVWLIGASVGIVFTMRNYQSAQADLAHMPENKINRAKRTVLKGSLMTQLTLLRYMAEALVLGLLSLVGAPSVLLALVAIAAQIELVVLSIRLVHKRREMLRELSQGQTDLPPTPQTLTGDTGLTYTLDDIQGEDK